MFNDDSNSLSVSSTKSDAAILEDNPNSHTEKSSTHPAPQTTHPQKFVGGGGGQRGHYQVTTAAITEIAKSIFETSGKGLKGLTYKHLVKKGRFKCADTPKQAQRILQYQKKRGNLYTLTPMTIPQQYFTKEDAEHAASNNKEKRGGNKRLDKFSTHPEPPGFSTCNPSLESLRKASSLGEAVRMASFESGGAVPTGIHNIQIQVQLPDELASEAYNERLAHIKPQETRPKPKKFEANIDNFLVTFLVYLRGKVVISIGCSNNPFPLQFEDSPELTASHFNSFVAEIRHTLKDELKDYRGRIVPPIESSAWRFVQADINWDVPTTTANFLRISDIQITHFNEIFRFYRKPLPYKPARYIRIEQGTHQFSDALTNTSFDDSLGPTIIAAVREAKKRLQVMAYGQREEREASGNGSA